MFRGIFVRPAFPRNGFPLYHNFQDAVPDVALIDLNNALCRAPEHVAIIIECRMANTTASEIGLAACRVEPASHVGASIAETVKFSAISIDNQDGILESFAAQVDGPAGVRQLRHFAELHRGLSAFELPQIGTQRLRTANPRNCFEKLHDSRQAPPPGCLGRPLPVLLAGTMG